jgi:branched-chain amino acid transport system permease protein
MGFAAVSPFYRFVAWCAGTSLLLVLPLFLSEYRLFQIGLIASTAIVAAGLVIAIGVAGQVSLAQAAFAAVGAYGSTILAQRFGLMPWAGIALSTVLAAVAGYVLGLATLRVEGHYLALATMAATAVVQLVLVNWESVTGGALGLAVEPLRFLGTQLASGRQLYYVVIPVAVAMLAVAAALITSRTGRALSALRQSEVAAQSLGINVLHYKALAFAISAVFGAVGGSLQALQTTYLDPQQFGILESVLLVAIIVVGGLRSIAGAALGSAVFTAIPEMLGGFQAYKGVAFALVVLVVIILFPGGIAGLLGQAIATLRPHLSRQARS